MMSNARRVTVVGGGISGAACANVLAAAGVQVTLRDRGRRLGGRMASRMLRDTGTAHDGRPVDIGASYFTAREPEFVAQVDQWTAAGVVRPWTDSFHVAGAEGIEGVRSGPMRFAAPRGLRSVVESMIDARVEVHSGDDVTELPSDEPVALCMPVPQARRLDDRIPDSSITWEPVIAVTCVFDERSWLDIDGVFVNDDPVLTWIADDGRRRGDDAPVLVAHVHPVLSAGHLQDPAAVVPQAVAAVRRVLGVVDYPAWVDAHRWTFAKPLTAHPEPYWLSPDGRVGVAGDLWAGGPRVEAAWLSGDALGRALASRMSGA
jgi:renalase